jgi:hypothetical protein
MQLDFASQVSPDLLGRGWGFTALSRVHPASAQASLRPANRQCKLREPLRRRGSLLTCIELRGPLCLTSKATSGSATQQQLSAST